MAQKTISPDGAIKDISNSSGLKVTKNIPPKKPKIINRGDEKRISYGDSLGSKVDFSDGKYVVETYINETDDQIILSTIGVKEVSDLTKTAKGTGLGTKVVESFKKYADKTGKQFVVPSVTTAADKYWESIPFLEYKYAPIPFEGKMQNVGKSYVYNPTKQQLTDIWKKAQASTSVVAEGVAKTAPSKAELPEITVKDFNQEQQPLPDKKIKVLPEVVTKANKMQQILGKPIVRRGVKGFPDGFSSGFRTLEYSKLLASQYPNVELEGMHPEGRAFDVPYKQLGLTQKEVVDAAHEAGFDVEDISLTPHHVHVELPTEGSPTKLMPKPGAEEAGGYGEGWEDDPMEIVSPDAIKQENGGSKLDMKIQKLEEQEQTLVASKEALEVIKDMQNEMKGRIKPYAKKGEGDLAEEYKELPAKYRASEGITMDEAASELSEMGIEVSEATLADYLKDLDAQAGRLPR